MSVKHGPSPGRGRSFLDMKATLGIIIGYVVWTIVWLAGNAGLSGAGLIPRASGVRVEGWVSLTALLVLSVVASLGGGYMARTIAKTGLAPVILGVLLLLTGIAVQWGSRDLMPVWYHVVFLVLLMPLTLLGARQSAAGRPARPTP